MAREVIIRIKDDLDPEQLADKTIQFGYTGTTYEIDLTAAHADNLTQALAPYIAVARIVQQQHPKRRHRRTPPAEAERVLAQDGAEQAVAAAPPRRKRAPRGAGASIARDAQRMRDDGEPMNVIAEALGVSKQTVYRALAKGPTSLERFGGSKAQRTKIRDWAATQPHLNQARTGQLRGVVVEAYFAAHPDEEPLGG